MNCAQKIGVYAVSVILCFCAQSFATYARGDKKNLANYAAAPSPSSAYSSEFQWKDHSQLSWEDFRGPVRTTNEEAAAATHCGIGFRTSQSPTTGKPEILVYNTFYINKSWVRPDARIPDILVHEQGHFDLCEVYTRKLKQRMSNVNFASSDLKFALMSIYNEISNEYESRQQAYEDETSHGTNLPEQKKWCRAIAGELN